MGCNCKNLEKKIKELERGNEPLQRIQLEEIKVCFYFNRFRK